MNPRTLKIEKDSESVKTVILVEKSLKVERKRKEAQSSMNPGLKKKFKVTKKGATIR